ncbi:MAG: ribosome maturation factor RimP [Magnetococcales bacterium]|nr:ribosome maturation factor RimP [Magnetococcales bacterium]
MSGTQTRLMQLAGEAAGAEACQLVDLEVASEGGARVVRLFVEKPDASLTLDHCAAVSERLSALLDAQDLIPGEYRLEVSSPGLTRPLKKREDFVRFQGKLAVIQTYVAIPWGEGKQGKKFKGVLRGVEDDTVLLLAQETMVRVPLRMISKANLDFEF